MLFIIQAVEGVLETMLPNDPEMALRYKDCHLIVLRGFQDPRGYGPLWTARQVLKVLAELPPEVRFNFDGIDILCRAHLLTMREFDVMLAQVSFLYTYFITKMILITNKLYLTILMFDFFYILYVCFYLYYSMA